MQRLVAIKHFLMKNLFFIISILSSVYSFGQCVNLYVKKHFSGDPICRLSEGDNLEICSESKTVSGGACGFYILKVRDTYNGMTIDLALDNVYWAPKYAELMINTNTQNFAFIIGNNSGAYSYYNESDMVKIREAEKIEREKLEKQRREEENRKAETDKNEYSKIDILVNDKKFKEAYLKIKSLYFPNKYENFTLVKKELKKIDSLYKIEISSNALKKNYSLALQNYDDLNFPDDFSFRPTDWIEMDEKAIVNEYEKRRSKNFEFLVKEYLQFRHSKDTNDLNNSEMLKFLELDKNKIAINKLNQGTYDFLITNTGRLFKDGEDVSNDFRIQSISKIFYKSFEVNINWRFRLEVKDSILNLTKYEQSTTKLKPIYLNINDAYKQSSLFIKSKNKQGQLKDLSNEFYFNQNTKDKLTLSTDYKFLDEFDDVEINFNKTVSDKVIEYSELKKKIRFVNNKEFSNLLVYSNFKDFPLIKKSFILKNIVDYSSGVAVLSVVIGGPTWLIIRFLEWSSAKFH